MYQLGLKRVPAAVAIAHSDTLEFWHTNCVRFPTFCVSSGDRLDGGDFFDAPVTDVNGVEYPWTWGDYIGQLASQGNPTTDLTIARNFYNLQKFYQNGYTGTLQLTNVLAIEVDIVPESRPIQCLVSIETIQTCAGLYGLEVDEAYITFDNTDNKFESYFKGGEQNKKFDCDNNETDYKNTEDDRIGKHFSIGIGFKWDLEGSYKECLPIISGYTIARGEKTLSDGGRECIKFKISNPFYNFLDLDYTNNNTDTLIGHLQSVFTYMDVDFQINTNYNPTFQVDFEGLSIREVLNKLALMGLARIYWDGEKVVYESIEWWQINRSQPVGEINTYCHITDIRPSTINETTSGVKVEQFTNPGGIENEYGDTSGTVVTITDECIQTQAMADYIGDGLWSVYENGTQQRIIETVGCPWIEKGDAYTIKERVDTVRDEDGNCENVYEVSTYRICGVSNFIGPGGYSQKLTVDKVGVLPFITLACVDQGLDPVTVCGTVTDPGAAVEVIIDGVSYNPTVNIDGTFCVPVSGLADGTYNVTALATDQAGNVLDTSCSFLVQSQPPPEPTFNDLDCLPVNPLLSGSAPQAVPNCPIVSVDIRIDFGAWQPTNLNGFSWNFQTGGITGTHTVQIMSTDCAGNTSIRTETITIDTTPPAAPVINPVVSPTVSSPVLVDGTGEPGATVCIIINGVTTTICTVVDPGGLWSVAVPLANGNNTIVATQTDCSGNVSTPSNIVTIVKI